MERFLDRVAHSKFADTFILKGGVLLAALDSRRPTRDIDFAVRAIENTTEKVLSAVQTIAAISLEDGMEEAQVKNSLFLVIIFAAASGAVLLGNLLARVNPQHNRNNQTFTGCL